MKVVGIGEPAQHMLQPGPAKKVTIHLNDDTASDRDFLYREILSFLLENDVSGATLIRPEAGFGSHHRVHKTGEGRGFSQHLPVRIEFVESPLKTESVLMALCQFMVDGLIEVQDTTVVKAVSQMETPV